MWEVYSEVGLVVVGSGVEKGETPSEKKMLFLYFQKYINCSENKDRQHIDFWEIHLRMDEHSFRYWIRYLNVWQAFMNT